MCLQRFLATLKLAGPTCGEHFRRRHKWAPQVPTLQENVVDTSMRQIGTSGIWPGRLDSREWVTGNGQVSYVTLNFEWVCVAVITCILQ